MTGAELISKFGAGTTQMTNFLGYKKNTVDLFSMPLDTVADLDVLTKAYRYHGMTMKVLNKDTTNIPEFYWFDDNDKTWKKMSNGGGADIEITGDDIEQ